MTTYKNGPGNVPCLPEFVVDQLVNDAGVSRLAYDDKDQSAQVNRLVHDTCEELLARLPVPPVLEHSAACAQASERANPASSDYVLMPKRLTAENGAKGALSGEFVESITVACHECEGVGEVDDGQKCAECDGEGTVEQRVAVGWDTIKRIYGRVVAMFASAAVPDALSQAARDVLAERRRQVEQKDWSHEHDDAHPNGEIAAYAAFYAMPPAARAWSTPELGYGDTLGHAIVPEGWRVPEDGDRRRELVKAGALILAEIERLDRAAQASGEVRECTSCDWKGTTDRMLGSIGPLCLACGDTTELSGEQKAGEA